MREELLQLVLPQLGGQAGPEGVQEERIDWSRAGHFVGSLAQPGDWVEEIPVWTSAIIINIE